MKTIPCPRCLKVRVGGEVTPRLLAEGFRVRDKCIYEKLTEKKDKK